MVEVEYIDETYLNVKLLPEVKAEWLKNLRSGEYRQECGSLRRITERDENGNPIFGYCCLGVLSDMYINDINSKQNSNLLNKSDEVIPLSVMWGDPGKLTEECPLNINSDTNTGMPMPQVLEWAFGNNLGSIIGIVDIQRPWQIYLDKEDAEKYSNFVVEGKNYIYLPSVNDAGTAFVHIAELIEKYL